jgi:hypothetical protein
VADDVMYYYACPPPYPAGYDASLAPREFRPGATALTRFQGMVCADLYNAVIVASTEPPQVDSPLGSPAAGSFVMTCAPFQAGATIDRATAVYLGATQWDFSATSMLPQAVRAGSWVLVDEPTSVDGLAANGTYSLWGFVLGTSEGLFPVTALRVLCNVFMRDNAQNSANVMFTNIIDEAIGSGMPVGAYWTFTINRDVAAAGSAQNMQQHVFEVEPGTGNIEIQSTGQDASDAIVFIGVGYQDAVLAAR